MQDEAVEVNQSLYDRLAIIKQRMGELEGQRGKLLDLNLDGDFQKELLLEHKTRLEETLEKLEREYHDVNAHIQKVVLSGVHIAEIDTFCASTREKLDNTNFEQI